MSTGIFFPPHDDPRVRTTFYPDCITHFYPPDAGEEGYTHDWGRDCRDCRALGLFQPGDPRHAAVPRVVYAVVDQGDNVLSIWDHCPAALAEAERGKGEGCYVTMFPLNASALLDEDGHEVADSFSFLEGTNDEVPISVG